MDILHSGIVPIYKPVGPTSFDVIAKLRKLTGERRIGHAGTLDPLASGVLVIAIGREFTKQLSSHVDSEKEYVATITLGVTSTTDDEQGEKTIHEVKKIPDRSEVEAAVKQFIGTIQQTPPIYSAIKINGTPAHRRVRKGQEVKLEPREVEIKNIEIISYTYPTLQINVTCNKGVYIRALARDIGEALKTGAYMSALERTRVGQYTVQDCLNIEIK